MYFCTSVFVLFTIKAGAADAGIPVGNSTKGATCFTRTKVQILTKKRFAARVKGRAVASLLRYWRQHSAQVDAAWMAMCSSKGDKALLREVVEMWAGCVVRD